MKDKLLKFLNKQIDYLEYIIIGFIILWMFLQYFPVKWGLAILTIILAVLAVLYIIKKSYSILFTGAGIGFLSYMIAGIYFGFIDIFPFMGIFFYFGYSIAYLLKATVFFPKNLIAKARWLYLVNVFLYILGGILYIILFPDTMFTYVPTITALVPSFIISFFIIFKMKIYKTDKWKIKVPLYIIIISVITLTSATFVLNSLLPGKNNIIALTEDEKIYYQQVKDKAENEPGIENLLEAGRVCFDHEFNEESEKYFTKVLKIDKNQPIALAYLAALKGLEADRTKNIKLKMKILNEARDKIDRVVELNSNNHEVVFIRAAFYSEIPAAFGTKKIVISDLIHILKDLPFDQEFFELSSHLLYKIAPDEINNFDAGLKEKVMKVIKESSNN